MRRSILRVAAVGGVAVMTAAAASPALARKRPPRHGVAVRAIATALLAHASNSQENPFFAGYEAAPSDGVASVSSNFKLPSFTCTGFDEVITSGVSAFGANTFGGALVLTTCNGAGNAPSYTLLGAVGDNIQTSGPVNPGDEISAVAYQTVLDSVATVTDLTTGATLRVSGAAATSSDSWTSYQVGLRDGNDSTRQIPQFKGVPFSGVEINGQPLALTGPTANDLVGLSGRVQVAVGPISANGKSFGLRFKHDQ